MLKRIALLLLVLFTAAVSVFGADRLAVAEPSVKGKIDPETVEGIWSMLEASVGGYELISRSALKQMMTEIGLTDSSNLVNLNSTQKARMGEIKTVKYLLIPSLSKFGKRYNLSLMVLDSSTGKISEEQRTSLTFNSLEELDDQLKDTLKEIGLGRAIRKSGRSALLTPVVKESKNAETAETLNTTLESMLLSSGVKLSNLQSVKKILQKNHLDALTETSPAMFIRIGELLRVDYLIQLTIDRFESKTMQTYIRASKRTVTTNHTLISGNVRIVNAKTGDVEASLPFVTDNSRSPNFISDLLAGLTGRIVQTVNK